MRLHPHFFCSMCSQNYLICSVDLSCSSSADAPCLLAGKAQHDNSDFNIHRASEQGCSKSSCRLKLRAAVHREHREAVHRLGGSAAEQLPSAEHFPMPESAGGQILPCPAAGLVSLPVSHPLYFLSCTVADLWNSRKA